MFFLSTIIPHKEQWQLQSVHRPVTWDWEFTELELGLHVRSLQQFFLQSLTIERKLQLMSSSSWWKLTILIVSFAINPPQIFISILMFGQLGCGFSSTNWQKEISRGVVYFWSCANICRKSQQCTVKRTYMHPSNTFWPRENPKCFDSYFIFW